MSMATLGRDQLCSLMHQPKYRYLGTYGDIEVMEEMENPRTYIMNAIVRSHPHTVFEEFQLLGTVPTNDAQTARFMTIDEVCLRLLFLCYDRYVLFLTHISAVRWSYCRIIVQYLIHIHTYALSLCVCLPPCFTILQFELIEREDNRDVYRIVFVTGGMTAPREVV